MNGVQTRFKCKLDVKRCKRFVFPPSSLLPRSNALKTKAIRYFQTDRTLTRIVSPPLDSCVGDFVKQYQETPLWKNTLFVLVPDHQGAYPYPIENPLDGQTIPLILIGGAIKQPLVVDTYASQIDIAATLLAQLGLPHDEFTFSKNILNPGSPHFAYFTRPDYFGMITADNQLVYNLDANTVQLDEGTAKGANLEKGKAFLQKLYDDLAKR